MKRQVLSIVAENTSGVLSRIAGLFTRRGFNIESITAGVTSDPKFSRITIVTGGDELILDQIEKQVLKLTDIVSVERLLPEASVERELILVKVKSDENTAIPIEFIATNRFRGNVVDSGENSLLIEVIGTQRKLKAFLDTMKKYGILEIARTGVTALSRGTSWDDEDM